MLPGLVEPIYMITVAASANQSSRLPDELSNRLTTAFDAGFPKPGAAGSATAASATPTTQQIIGTFPDLSKILDPLHATLAAAVTATSATVEISTLKAFDKVGAALVVMGGKFDAAIEREADLSRRVLGGHIATITTNADAMAKAISVPLGAKGPATGLEDLADAYQTWLTSKGTLDTILTRATEHLTHVSAASEPAGPLDLMRGAYDRPRASIEIERVEIVIDPPPAKSPVPGDLVPDRPLTDQDIWLACKRHALELDDRGVRPADLRSVIS